MRQYYFSFLKTLERLESNIAFYPTLISLGGVTFAFFMIYLESIGISRYLVEAAPILVVNNTETARSLLTTFIGGLISIMVFSFSLVMILLNQASANFSPRVLPGLISNKRHQVILGIYNGTLLYSIFTLVSIAPHGDKYQMPGFSVLLGIIFMTMSLGAFIYFIHSISQQIQVGTIMDKIFKKSQARLLKLVESEKHLETDFEDTANWNEIMASQTGYMQDVSLNVLGTLAEEHQLKIEIVPIKGAYVLKGIPILKYKGDVDDELKEKLLDAVMFSKSELIEDNYVLAFKQITEIALKAMSPGINDPGTCINAIDYLTELFALRMTKKNKSFYFSEDDEALIYVRTVSFEQLLYNVMAALRTYCKHDIIVVQKLFTMLQYLLQNREVLRENYKESIISEIRNLKIDALANHENEADIKVINNIIKHLEDLNPSDYKFDSNT
ncbi:DUF2254 domain-containing protein [Subsaximicrobium wynnwilliamsii]|uniref:DUF2254 domain-containing protein n=1 Tax=Subsaximicrobium wynnwilliamsii TaxID=291179 RepID=A0A5C6ZNM8_9FLAO|nr:DUF2254 domain-containing protein [Subsaximicrobium wynnwilliamsii]TXD85571.1 DUF2254 domain-containing protein [Subsaximicrobium wynnwilliamsii]TXD90924.1 DUF2254 domain-containing protein [Subsaximicrobium wynnwilliamsii]TXE05431.1 DUF2254 domain-containing protein [Subsaximicrobium wynnwilliamsii]